MLSDEELAEIQKAAEVAVMNEREARTGYGFSGSPEARRAGIRAVAVASAVAAFKEYADALEQNPSAEYWDKPTQVADVRDWGTGITERSQLAN